MRGYLDFKWYFNFNNYYWKTYLNKFLPAFLYSRFKRKYSKSA